MSKVVSLTGAHNTQFGKPSVALIKLLKGLLAKAESGELQTVALVGSSSIPGNVISAHYLPDGTNVYEIIGQLHAQITLVSSKMIVDE